MLGAQAKVGLAMWADCCVVQMNAAHAGNATIARKSSPALCSLALAVSARLEQQSVQLLELLLAAMRATLHCWLWTAGS